MRHWTKAAAVGLRTTSVDTQSAAIDGFARGPVDCCRAAHVDRVGTGSPVFSRSAAERARAVVPNGS